MVLLEVEKPISIIASSCMYEPIHQIALAVASSGIAALLFRGGRTAHSRFKIPITAIDGNATCNINDLSFGGKVFLIGGDFRQVLPVIHKGTRAQIVGAALNKSYLWHHVHVF